MAILWLCKFLKQLLKLYEIYLSHEFSKLCRKQLPTQATSVPPEFAHKMLFRNSFA